MVVCGGVRNVIAWQIRSYIDCNDIVILLVYYIPLPSPFFLLPVLYPLPCRVPFPVISVKFLT